MQQPERVFTPGEAAAELGITTQSLRRYAQHYGEVFAPVGQHAKQRIFTDEVIDRLRAAQVLQQAGRVQSIRAALELLRDGLADAETLATGQQAPDPITVLADTVRALTEEIKALRATVELQSEQLKALEAPKEEVQVRQPWWKLWG